jgi:signal transduction histidine kinase
MDKARVGRLEFDELLAQLIERAQEVMATEERLRGLLEAYQSVASDLSLPVVLRRIAEAARQLVGARYAALGVVHEDRHAHFIHVGMDEATVEQIGHLPEGKGILGLLIEDPRALRLRRLADHPRSVGFPSGHPPMATFLGVPVRVHDAVFGNLYLTEKEGGGEFSRDDEELVLALAAAAGLAIENAQLFAQAERRLRWADASTQIAIALLTGYERGEALTLVASAARKVAEAHLVVIVLPTETGDHLIVEAADGVGAADLVGTVVPAEGSLAGRAMRGESTLVIDDLATVETSNELGRPIEIGPVVIAPLRLEPGSHRDGREGVESGAIGAMAVCYNRNQPKVDAEGEAMVTSFAAQATLAFELAQARAAGERLLVLEDRDRIARDLHDLIIQRIFATGLALQGMVRYLPSAEGQAKLAERVDELDATMRDIRTSIFALRARERGGTGVRAEVLELVSESTNLLGFTPRLRLDGPIDSAASPEVADALLAVLRESLTNVVKHAHASQVDVRLTARAGDVLLLEVIDNGVGLGVPTRSSGVANMADRAAALGGTCSVETRPDGGTVARWEVPIS